MLPLLVGWLAGCKENPNEPTAPTDSELGRDFLPVAVGRFWVYDVTDIIWNFNDSAVTRYQMRERVDTLYVEADGEPTFRVVRSRRADALSPWRDDTAFALALTPQLVRRTLANRPTVELIFPVRDGKSWNPNLFNSLDSTERRYADFDQPLALPNGQQFAQSVRVVDLGEDNLINYSETSSAYARGVGRVSRVRRMLKFCEENDVAGTGCSPGSGYIVRGQEHEEYLRDYGPH